MPDAEFSLHGPIVALASVDDGFAAAHATGVISRNGYDSVDLGVALTSLAALTTPDETVLLVGDSIGDVHFVSQTARSNAQHATSSIAAGFPLSSIAVQDDGARGASAPLVAFGEGRRGGVSVFAAEALLSGATGAVASWRGFAGGGAGPGVRTVRWWPHSATTLLAAAGTRVLFMDTRSPSGGGAAAALRMPHLIGAAGKSVATAPLVLDVLLPRGSDDPWAAFGALEDGRIVVWDLRRPGSPRGTSPASGSSEHIGAAWSIVAAPPASVTSAAGVGCVVVSAGEDGTLRAHAAGATGDLLALQSSPLSVSSRALRSVIVGRAAGSSGTSTVAPACVFIAAGDAGSILSVPAMDVYQ